MQSAPSGPGVVSGAMTPSSAPSTREQPAEVGKATTGRNRQTHRVSKQTKPASKNRHSLTEKLLVAAAEKGSSSSSPAMSPSSVLESGLSTSPLLVKEDLSRPAPDSRGENHTNAASSPYKPCLEISCDSSEADKGADVWYEDIFHRQLYSCTHGSDFGQVSDNVGSLVMQFFPSKCQWKQLDDDTRQKLSNIYPRAVNLVEDGGEGARALFAAYIFRILNERLFTAQDKWATPAWLSFGSVCSVRGSFDKTSFFAHSFHHGTHHMARILRVHEGPHVETTWLVNVLHEAIQPFINISSNKSQEVANNDETTSSLNQMLLDLAVCAIKIDFAMVSSPYRIEMEIQDQHTGAAYAFPFRKTDMSAWHGDSRFDYEGLTIDFIVEPMLRTYGPPRDFPTDKAKFNQYFASVLGGYSDCMMSTTMKVFVDHSG